MTRSLGAIVLVLMGFSWLSAGTESAISGRITDSQGAVIANARVLVHWDSSGSTVGLRDNVGLKQDVVVVTDASGRYSRNVLAGFYDVFVSAMAFTPTATKLRVKDGKSSNFDAKLKVDPLASKELGHDIYAAPK